MCLLPPPGHTPHPHAPPSCFALHGSCCSERPLPVPPALLILKGPASSPAGLRPGKWDLKTATEARAEVERERLPPLPTFVLTLESRTFPLLVDQALGSLHQVSYKLRPVGVGRGQHLCQQRSLACSHSPLSQRAVFCSKDMALRWGFHGPLSQSPWLAVLRGQITHISLGTVAGPLHTAAPQPTYCWKRDQGLQRGMSHTWESQAPGGQTFAKQGETRAPRVELGQGQNAQSQDPSSCPALGHCPQPGSEVSYFFTPTCREDRALFPGGGSPDLGRAWSRGGGLGWKPKGSQSLETEEPGRARH